MIDVGWLERRGPGRAVAVTLPRVGKVGAGNCVEGAGVVPGAVIREFRGVPGRLPVRSVDKEGQELERIALDEEDTPSRLGWTEVNVGIFERLDASRSQHKHGDEDKSFQHGGLPDWNELKCRPAKRVARRSACDPALSRRVRLRGSGSIPAALILSHR